MKRAELEKREEKFDIIVGDLADPVEGGPCYQLYTKSFYQNILKPKLTPNGIFVTQVFHFCLLVYNLGERKIIKTLSFDIELFHILKNIGWTSRDIHS